MQEAERLRADNSNNQIYQNCYSLWYNYYMAQNAQAVTELFNTSAHKYHENLSQNVEKYVTQY